MSEERFPFLAPKGDGTLLAVHVQPRAAKNELSGIFQDRLKVRVCSPPVEGEANRQCMNLLAEVLGVSKSEITLVRGGQSRRKTFLISKPIEFVCEKFKKVGFKSH